MLEYEGNQSRLNLEENTELPDSASESPMEKLNCNRCNDTFSKSEDLNAHTVTHSQVSINCDLNQNTRESEIKTTNHKCDLCGKDFSDVTNGDKETRISFVPKLSLFSLQEPLYVPEFIQ